MSPGLASTHSLADMANSAASDGLSYFAQDLKLSCFPVLQWEDIESSFAVLKLFLGVMSNCFTLERK